ncbi:RusA family crossover junction endodeoxyribonuclease [Acidaminococcus sp. DS4831]|uniref:RusA family crossover junction endodeoxyribonuclease n=1 Tax=Acidaminococcus sp. DS4831 TaxID=3141399 RepID=UPI0032E3C8D5
MSVSVSREAGKWKVEIIVMGEPVAQGRPRFSQVCGHVTARDPDKSKNYKALVRSEAQRIYEMDKAFAPIDGPCYMLLTVGRSIPKSWSKKKQAMAIKGEIRPTSKPDLDNYIKGILDAINTVIVKDDSRVVGINAIKRYQSNPGVDIIIIED